MRRLVSWTELGTEGGDAGQPGAEQLFFLFALNSTSTHRMSGTRAHSHGNKDMTSLENIATTELLLRTTLKAGTRRGAHVGGVHRLTESEWLQKG